MNRKLIISAALWFSIPLAALAGNDAGLPGEFLDFGVGARALGMGSAFTAVANDVDALYWNPAGLATFRSSQVTFQQAPMPLQTSYQYLGYAQPLYAMGSIGVGIVSVGSSGVDRVDANNSVIGTFDSRETGYLAAYAHRFGDKLSLGSTLKMVQKSIDGRSETGFGADAGALYRPSETLSYGVMLRNLVAPSYNYSTDKETFPTVLRTGIAKQWLNQHLTTALDIDKTIGTPQGWKWHAGVEGFAVDNVYLRAGLDATEITSGIGLKWRSLQFDYGIGFQQLGTVNRFSVKMVFGGYEVDMKASPKVFSPVGLVPKTTFKVRTTHRDRIVKWIMTIRDTKGDVVQTFQGFDAPPDTMEWDGKDAQGRVVEAGRYTYRMMITDAKNQTEKTPLRTVRIIAPTPFEIEAK